MVALDTLKMRISHRDLLLLLGILVAVIIAVTTLIYKEGINYSKQTTAPQKSSLNITPAVISKKLFEKVGF
jgi:hypothetical protein